MTDPNETADLVNKLREGYLEHVAAEKGTAEDLDDGDLDDEDLEDDPDCE